MSGVVVTLHMTENERTLTGLLHDHGLTTVQVRAGLKYYRNLLSKFDKYQESPEKAVGPIIRNLENMKAGYDDT